jgi:threonine dehydrogenase-like Zn-dependent dehydrogenase
MKILQIGAYPEFAVLDVPIPEPGPGEVLLRVEAVTTCPQWDLHLRHNEPMFLGHRFHYPYTPGQPGHEATGTIAVLGEGVTGLIVGQRVSAWRDSGHGRQGCYAQFVALDAESVIPVPADLPYSATASVELAMCVGATFLMLREMNVLAGQAVGIMGLGPAGLIAAQMARAEGASAVTGFDLSETRCRYALNRGLVNQAYDPRAVSDDLLPSRPRRATLHCGIDCVGAKRSVEWLMDHVRDTVALFGVQREEYAFAPRHYHPMLRLCGYPGHSRAAAEYAVALIAVGKLDLTPLVTHTLPLEHYNDAIDLLESQQAIKVCFTPWAADPA